MITFKADNRILTRDAKYSYTIDNYYSGYTSPYYLANVDGFAINNYVLIGNIGSESAEILKIASVNTTNQYITFKDEAGSTVYPKFSHAESSRVTVIPYNKVRFFWSAVPVDPVAPVIDPTNPSFNDATGLPVNTITFYDITPSKIYTTYDDVTHSSGYGWFLFYNFNDSIYSQPSNAIPYDGFESNSLQKIIEGFFSELNNKEAKLISYDDAIMWATEGYTKVITALNLTNMEYSLSAKVPVSINANQQEYLLNSNINDIVSMVNGSVEISKISVSQIDSYTGSETRFYIRGKYLGFVPTPTESATYYYRYTSIPTDLKIYTDKVNLPDGGHFILKLFMMARAYSKLTNMQMATAKMSEFNEEVKNLKISAKSRDGGLDSWGIADQSNV